MVLDAGGKQYSIIREVLTGAVNDVYVCRSAREPSAPYRTVWIVRQHDFALTLLREFACGDGGSCAYEECFPQGADMCFVFPYVPERPLKRFYAGTVQGGGCSREQIWRNLVAGCMTQGIPESVLNLILKQGQVELQPDGSIDFEFFVDLQEYDTSVTESDNVALCTKLIEELIRLEGRKEDRMAAQLLEKKLERKEYPDFLQLYKDMKLVTQDSRGIRRKKPLLVLAERDWEGLYRILACTCCVLAVAAALALAGYLLFGKDTVFRLFDGPLEQIGTESLLQ